MYFSLFPQDGKWRFMQIVSSGDGLREGSGPVLLGYVRGVSVCLTLKLLTRVPSIKHDRNRRYISYCSRRTGNGFSCKLSPVEIACTRVPVRFSRICKRCFSMPYPENFTQSAKH